MSSSIQTVVFADIAGSTALYGALGNAAAALLVSDVTQGMGACVRQQGGRVVKKLGDGVLAVFADAQTAMAAMAHCMRLQQEWAQGQPPMLRLRMCVGMACGEVLNVDGDCYGDAVNVASRLCERADGDEIWVAQSVVERLAPQHGMALVRLGRLEVRGKSEPIAAWQLQWREEQERGQGALTQPGLPSELGAFAATAPEMRLELGWEQQRRVFTAVQGPVQIGRSADAQMCVPDPRVSRLHARVQWRQGACEYTDLSSYGSWVRFEGNEQAVALRRDSCLLHGRGEIALGVGFSDASAPLLRFELQGGGALLLG